MNEYKSVLNSIRTILGMEKIEDVEKDVKLEEEVVKEVKLAESKLEDGSIIYYDGELAVETALFADAELTTPVDDGDYVLEDGTKINVVEGKVAEITPVETPAETPEETPVEQEKEIDFEKLYNELKEVVDELKSKLTKFEKQEVELKSEIEKLSIEPEVESITNETQDKRVLTDIEKRLNTLESIRMMNKK